MNILITLLILGVGIHAFRAALLNKRPGRYAKFGFDKKVNWDHFGRELTGFSGLVFIVWGTIALFVLIMGKFGISNLKELLELIG